MKKLLLMVAFLATSVFVLSSCSKDKDEPKGSVKVQYKLIGSSNVALSSVTYTNANGDITGNTGLSGNTWTSEEFTVPRSVKAVTFTGGAISNDSNAELRGQIIIDGKVVKDNTSKGTTLAIVLQTEL